MGAENEVDFIEKTHKRIPIVWMSMSECAGDQCALSDVNSLSQWHHEMQFLSYEKIWKEMLFVWKNCEKVWKIREICLSLQRERRNRVEPRCAERWHGCGNAEMMSNSTLPLGFLHSYTELVTCWPVFIFYDIWAIMGSVLAGASGRAERSLITW